MANSYSIKRRTWKSTKKLFFNLFDLPIRNGNILFSSLVVRKFCIAIFRTFYWGNYWHTLDMNGVQRSIGRSPAAATQVVRFEECGRKHWPISSATRRRFRVCAEKGVIRNVSVICEKCDVALCCDGRCFVDYHSKADPWNISGCSTRSPYLKLWPQLQM